MRYLHGFYLHQCIHWALVPCEWGRSHLGGDHAHQDRPASSSDKGDRSEGVNSMPSTTWRMCQYVLNFNMLSICGVVLASHKYFFLVNKKYFWISMHHLLDIVSNRQPKTMAEWFQLGESGHKTIKTTQINSLYSIAVYNAGKMKANIFHVTLL